MASVAKRNHDKVVIYFASALFKMSDRYRPIADIRVLKSGRSR